MPLFILATRLTGEEIHPTLQLEQKEDEVARRIKEADLEIEWIGNYAIMGPFDYIDIFHAPNQETAMKLSTLVRSFGRAHTEVWGAMEWDRFKEVLADIPKIFPLGVRSSQGGEGKKNRKGA